LLFIKRIWSNQFIPLKIRFIFVKHNAIRAESFNLETLTQHRFSSFCGWKASQLAVSFPPAGEGVAVAALLPFPQDLRCSLRCVEEGRADLWKKISVSWRAKFAQFNYRKSPIAGFRSVAAQRSANSIALGAA
jgi:hypothetical protein